MTQALGPHDVRPDDPLVRWMVPSRDADLQHAQHSRASGASIAWLGRAARPGERWVTGLGEDVDVVVELVTQLVSTYDIEGVTVPADVFSHLPTNLRSPRPGHWSLWTLDPREALLEPSGAVDLAPEDDRILELLRGHSTSAHVFPGDPRVVQWAGVQDGRRLAAVAGRLREPSGAAHLVSVCTDPAYRGRGLARQACQRLMASSIEDGAPMIVLEMYTDNEAGRRTYAGLGFAEVGRYSSGLLAHALPTVHP